MIVNKFPIKQLYDKEAMANKDLKLKCFTSDWQVIPNKFDLIGKGKFIGHFTDTAQNPHVAVTTPDGSRFLIKGENNYSVAAADIDEQNLYEQGLKDVKQTVAANEKKENEPNAIEKAAANVGGGIFKLLVIGMVLAAIAFVVENKLKG